MNTLLFPICHWSRSMLTAFIRCSTPLRTSPFHRGQVSLVSIAYLATRLKKIIILPVEFIVKSVTIRINSEFARWTTKKPLKRLKLNAHSGHLKQWVGRRGHKSGATGTSSILKAIGKIEPQIFNFFFSYAICFNLLHLKPSLLPVALISFFGFVFAR